MGYNHLADGIRGAPFLLLDPRCGDTTAMNPLEMQPTFVVSVPDGVEQALAKLRRAIRSSELAGHAESAGPCVDFKIAPQERRFWSPHLSVHLSEQGDGTELYCRFSPRPEIWTGVMAVYFGAVFVMFVAAVYGYVQWFLGTAPWALLAIPAAAAVIAALHMASLIGQRLSVDQMQLLRSRFDLAMSLAFGTPLPAPASELVAVENRPASLPQ